MNRTVVSLLAALMCLGCLALAAMFGYGRYRSAKARDAEFNSALRTRATQQLDVRMPAQLGNPRERRTQQDQDTLDRMRRVPADDLGNP